MLWGETRSKVVLQWSCNVTHVGGNRSAFGSGTGANEISRYISTCNGAGQ